MLSNASLIIWICPAIHEILVNKAFTITDDLISWLFVITFVHPTHVQIALIWGFSVQLSLWKLVYWLWRYKLNKVCNILTYLSQLLTNKPLLSNNILQRFLTIQPHYFAVRLSNVLLDVLLNWNRLLNT